MKLTGDGGGVRISAIDHLSPRDVTTSRAAAYCAMSWRLIAAAINSGTTNYLLWYDKFSYLV